MPSSPDFLLKVRQPTLEEVPQMKDGGLLASFIYPAQNKDLIKALNDKNMTVFGELYFGCFIMVAADCYHVQSTKVV